ncbi:hypothetical protein [Streptomyces sp. NPDC058202]|uniref:hypothetical protein n=1 Tax=Streptomyces sp. NPDC058202 TaxID=3346380 RepID=UPI0036E33CD0
MAAVDTDHVAVRPQCMDRASPEFVGIPAPPGGRCTAAHFDLHWANLTAPLRILDWEEWGRAPEGFDAATLYAYSLLQVDVAARVRAAFPVLGSPTGLAAEATVCTQLLQTVSRGDNLRLKDQLQHCPRNSAVTECATPPCPGRRYRALMRDGQSVPA